MMGKLIMCIMKVFGKTIILMICIGLVFVVYKANQPMAVADAPERMTYVEFIKDRIDAAKTVEPSRCGWGMMLSLATLGPIYSVVYTAVAIKPDSTLAKMTAPDPDIPKGLKVPGGSKFQEFGGEWSNDYPGRCWISRPARDASLGQ